MSNRDRLHISTEGECELTSFTPTEFNCTTVRKAKRNLINFTQGSHR